MFLLKQTAAISASAFLQADGEEKKWTSCQWSLDSCCACFLHKFVCLLFPSSIWHNITLFYSSSNWACWSFSSIQRLCCGPTLKISRNGYMNLGNLLLMTINPLIPLLTCANHWFCLSCSSFGSKGINASWWWVATNNFIDYSSCAWST